MLKPGRLAVVLIIATIQLGVTRTYANQALQRTFTNSPHGFSISFPDDWAEMPPETLKAANEAFAVQLPGAQRPVLHYGYQMTNSTGLAFAPFALIRVHDKPSDPKAVLADMEKDDLPQVVQRGKPLFDNELHAYLVDYQAEFAGKAIDASVAYFLTKRSVIKIFFYLPRNEPHLALLVKQIIKDIRISDEIRISPAAPPMRGGLAIALVAVAVIVIVLSRAKPGKATDPPSTGCD